MAVLDVITLDAIQLCIFSSDDELNYCVPLVLQCEWIVQVLVYPLNVQP